MPFVMSQNRLLTTPHDLHRFPQPLRRQRQHNLDGHILATAEGAADRRVDHPNSVLWHTKGVGNLSLIFVRPLPGDNNRDPALFVKIGEPGLRLQVGMLLPGNLVGGLDDHVGLQQSGLDIAAPDPVARHQVALKDQLRVLRDSGIIRVQCGGFLTQRIARIRNYRQILILHLDESQCTLRGVLIGGNNSRHLISDKTHDIHPFLLPGGVGSCRATEHGLVRVLQAVFVDGHIERRQDSLDSGKRFGHSRVHPNHTRVRTPCIQQLHRQRAFLMEITRIERLTGHLLPGVEARE